MTMSESDLCELVAQWVMEQNPDAKIHGELDWGGELVPRGCNGRESTDMIVIEGEEPNTRYTAIEVKRRLDDKLVDQAWRLVSSRSSHSKPPVPALVHRVMVAVPTPKSVGVQHKIRRERLPGSCGILYINDYGCDVARVAHEYPSPDLAPLLRCLHAKQLGQKPGSAGMVRVRPDKWDPVRALLDGGEWLTLKQLKLEFSVFSEPEWRSFTKKVRDREMRGVQVEYRQGYPHYHLAK